nr:hypothetical protein [uncultured Methanobacterium sp.]
MDISNKSREQLLAELKDSYEEISILKRKTRNLKGISRSLKMISRNLNWIS